MHIDLFGVVLFLHISVAIVAFAMAGVMHTSLQAVARARMVQELRSWGQVMHRLEPLFPIMALLLLGLGIWLVHLGHGTDDAFSFKDGWVITAIVTLVAVEAVGGAVLAPRGKQFTAMIENAPDGAVAADLHGRAVDPAVWYAAHITTFAFLGVVFLMATKPEGQWAWVFPTAGAVLGILLSKVQLDALNTADGGAVPAQRKGAETSAKAKA